MTFKTEITHFFLQSYSSSFMVFYYDYDFSCYFFFWKLRMNEEAMEGSLEGKKFWKLYIYIKPKRQGKKAIETEKNFEI